MNRSRWLRLATALFFPLLLLSACNHAPAPAGGAQSASPTLTVAAAADLQPALTELAKEYQQETGVQVVLSFGATGNLAKQIENGAPVDLFAAASLDYVDGLNQKGLVVPDTVAVYATGRIVLAVNKASGVKAATLTDLLDPSIKHVAIANPETAPYGRLAREALTKAGLWTPLQSKLVFGESIAQTLQFVQTGNAEVGILSLSMARVPEIEVHTIDASLYTPLQQGVAVIKGSHNEQAARRFAAFILGAQGRAVFTQYGYGTP
ncbi:MAG: molybdate ABC transporter substrate-binding protein [Mycobacterium leprae]